MYRPFKKPGTCPTQWDVPGLKMFGPAFERGSNLGQIGHLGDPKFSAVALQELLLHASIHTTDSPPGIKVNSKDLDPVFIGLSVPTSEKLHGGTSDGRQSPREPCQITTEFFPFQVRRSNQVRTDVKVLNAEPEPGVRFDAITNLEPEPGVQFSSVQYSEEILPSKNVHRWLQFKLVKYCGGCIRHLLADLKVETLYLELGLFIPKILTAFLYGFH
ncbi:hypothetical protein DFH06DRAFT_1131577 [Mycena polygramma]|nr:hypothetical protein DFH06DRAFT_1131577 [Mycena polygramma]